MATVIQLPEGAPDTDTEQKKTVIKKDQRPGRSHIYAELPKRIIFQVFNVISKKLEPYGSMIWTGDQWDVENDNKFHSIASMLNETRGFGGMILSKKDREFYMPFYHTPTTGWKVDVEPVPPSYRQ